MTDIRRLLERMAAEEAAFAETRFVAPCVRGGQVRARVGGIVQTFATSPADFEGWGLFQAGIGTVATLVEEADLPLVGEYLKQFPLLRLRLSRALSGLAWLAHPASEADMEQRFKAARPVAVHLVTEGTAFEQITARNVGGAWWFEEVDRRADPEPMERLRDALRQQTEPDTLQFKGLTPEMRAAYDLALQATPAYREARRRREEQERQERLRAQVNAAERQYRDDSGFEWYVEAHWDEYQAAVGEPAPEPHSETQNRRERRHRRRQGDRRQPPPDQARLENALRTGGGSLDSYTDRGNYWLVEWTSRKGARHTSAIAKADLTVISSGICLSGRDRDFDLESLVGVLERA